MTHTEAEILVQRIGAETRGALRGVKMWDGPSEYVVVCTDRATNRQFTIDDPEWTPPRRGQEARP